MEFIIFGGGYLVKKYYLTSIGGKLLSIWLFIIAFATTIFLFIFSSQVETITIAFSTFFTIFALFGIFLCFNNTITINYKTNELVVTTFKKKKFALQNIYKIIVSTKNSINPKKYCNIIFFFKDNQTYFISGFLSVFKYKDVEKSQKLVDEIIEELNLI